MVTDTNIPTLRRVIDDAAPNDRRRYREVAAAMWASAVGSPLAPGQAARLHIPVTLGLTAFHADDLADTLYRLFGPQQMLDLEGAETDHAWPCVFSMLSNPPKAREVNVEDFDEIHGDDEWPVYTRRTWHAPH